MRRRLKPARALGGKTRGQIDLVQFVLDESGEAISLEFGTAADFAPGDVVNYGVQSFQVVAVCQADSDENVGTVVVRPITPP
jgi:hypothetical protein